MNRLLLSLAGLTALYALLAAFNLQAHITGCEGRPFCVLFSNVPHPWIPLFSIEQVGGFTDSFLVFGMALPALLPLVVLLYLGQRPFSFDSALVRSTLIAAGLLAFYLGLGFAGLRSNDYGPHPVIFWQQCQIVQVFSKFLAATMTMSVVVGTATLLLRQTARGLKAALSRNDDQH